MHLELAVLEQALNFLGHLALDAIAHLDHALDLVAAHFLDIAHVQKAHVHVALGELVAQDVFNLGDLKLGVANQGHLFVFEFNGGGRAFEVKAGGDFFGGVFHRVLHIHHVGIANCVERGHGNSSGKRAVKK